MDQSEYHFESYSHIYIFKEKVFFAENDKDPQQLTF